MIDPENDLLVRAIPLFFSGLLLFVLAAMALVQSLIARKLGKRPWFDGLSVPLTLGLSALGLWLWAQSANFADLYAPPSSFFDANRLWIFAASMIGLPFAVRELWRGVRRLIALYRNPPPTKRIVLDIPADVEPEIRIEAQPARPEGDRS